MSTGILTGTYKRPDGTARTGTVTITPSVAVVRNSAGNIILAGPVSADLDASGSFTVTLAASNDSALDPAGVTYKVTGHGALRGIPPVAGIAVPAGQTIDMADVTTVDPAAPTYAPWVYGTGGGSGTITSVNGNVGPTVVLGASDVGARPVSYVPTWTEVTGKPTTFAPSAHTHPLSDITGSRRYGLTPGRRLEAIIDGCTSAGGAVTTAMTPTFTNITIPLNLVRKATRNGFTLSANKVVAPAGIPPMNVRVDTAVRFEAGAAGLRGVNFRRSDATLMFEYDTYTSGNTQVAGGRNIPVAAGDQFTLEGFANLASVNVVERGFGLGEVRVHLVAADLLPVAACPVGYTMPSGQTTTGMARDINGDWGRTDTWANLAAGITDTNTLAWCAANPTKKLDFGCGLIPHTGIAAASWDATLDAVTAGTYDANFTTLGTNLAAQGPATVYLRPWWEMDLNNVRVNITPAKFKAAWARAVPLIRAAFAAAAPTKTLKIVFCYNGSSDYAGSLDCYPTLETDVDIIGSDIYGLVFGTTLPTTTAVQAKVQTRLDQLSLFSLAHANKPVALCEFGMWQIGTNGVNDSHGAADDALLADVYANWIEQNSPEYVVLFGYGNAGVPALSATPLFRDRVIYRFGLLTP